MAEWKYAAPGNLTDFRNPENWHRQMAKAAEDIVILLLADALQKGPGDITQKDIEDNKDKLAYVNPVWDAIPEAASTVPITPWGGFPRAVERRGPWTEFPDDPVDPLGIYRATDHYGDEDFRPGVFVDSEDRVLHLPARDRQDEYLEWHATYDEDKNITKIAFVSEGYDYFAKLFEHDEQRVLEIYKELTGNSLIKTEELRAKNGIYRRSVKGGVATIVEPGAFNPRNRHNISGGIVHLSHRANSLEAEVNLAGVSGLARKIASGETLDGKDSQRLLCCNEGGNPNRNSDPLISSEAYALVMASMRYTLADPVGLYIAGIENDALLLPDQSGPIPREWWKVVRGEGLWEENGGKSNSRVLRVELEVPKSENGRTISDLWIGGSRVKYPAQIAELIKVHLFVSTWKRDNDDIGPIVNCLGTCCVRDESDELKFPEEDGTCKKGWSLKYPGLIVDKNAQPAKADPANSPTMVPTGKSVLGVRN